MRLWYHFLLAVKHISDPRESETLLASDLGNRAFGSKVSSQDLDVPAGLDWLVKGHNHLLFVIKVTGTCHILGQSLPCHCHTVSLHEAARKFLRQSEKMIIINKVKQNALAHSSGGT